MYPRILLTDTFVQITCERMDIDTQRFMLTLPPVHSNRIHTVFKTSVTNLPEILQEFRGITEANGDTMPPAIYDAYTKELMRRSLVDTLRNGTPDGDPRVNEFLTLDEHQQRGRNIATVFDKYAFFYDTRTGKTPMSLSIINDDIKRNPEHKWLVVCPLILIENAWLPDAAQFLPGVKIVNCHAATKIKRIKAMQQEANIYVTNTESFVSYSDHFNDMGFTGCFVDESSDMKSTKSKISHCLVDFAQTLKRFYLLSGTPAPNGEHEYFMQMRSIDYYSMPSSYAQFKEYYFVNLSYNPQYEKLSLRPDKKEEFFSTIKAHAIYVDKEDVLETPGRDFFEVPFDLPADLKKHYTKLKNDMALVVNDTIITSAHAAATINKLNQVSSGFIIDTAAVRNNKFYEESSEPEWYLLDDFRFKRLLELLHEPALEGEQAIIWANYRLEFSQIERILTENGLTCRCVHGGVSLKDKNEAIRMFKNKEIQYLLANPASADKGLTLTNAHIAVYFSLNWSYELYKQSMERIYGAVRSQPKRCAYYIMLANRTIDCVLYNDVLQGKRDVSYAVLNHLKGDTNGVQQEDKS